MIVTGEDGSHNNTPIARGTAGSVDPKENRLNARKSERFCLEVKLDIHDIFLTKKFSLFHRYKRTGMAV